MVKFNFEKNSYFIDELNDDFYIEMQNIKEYIDDCGIKRFLIQLKDEDKINTLRKAFRTEQIQRVREIPKYFIGKQFTIDKQLIEFFENGYLEVDNNWIVTNPIKITDMIIAIKQKESSENFVEVVYDPFLINII